MLKRDNKSKYLSFISSAILHAVLIFILTAFGGKLNIFKEKLHYTSDSFTFKIGLKTPEQTVLNKTADKKKSTKKSKDKTFFDDIYNIKKSSNKLFVDSNKLSYLLNNPLGENGTQKYTKCSKEEASRYIGEIRSKIQKTIYYPLKAQALNAEGTVLVVFCINKNGKISEIDIESISNHTILNKAALTIVKKASPFPIPPLNFSHRIQVPIVFRIKNDS